MPLDKSIDDRVSFLLLSFSELESHHGVRVFNRLDLRCLCCGCFLRYIISVMLDIQTNSFNIGEITLLSPAQVFGALLQYPVDERFDHLSEGRCNHISDRGRRIKTRELCFQFLVDVIPVLVNVGHCPHSVNTSFDLHVSDVNLEHLSCC